jgi:nucleoside-diphosphate-sugar epimerase
MMRNQPVEVFDCNGAFNNAVHVKDLCRFIVTLIRAELSGSEILTLGSEGVMSISMATERLLRGLGSGSEIIESESKKPAFSISIEKARKHFGYAPMDTETMLDHYAQEMLGATSQRVSGLA